MEFVQVDVFCDGPYTGNPLAVFPDAGALTRHQMQALAREMNLSETTFVGEIGEDSYSVRIFTPVEELPFAGHPTIGTAWVLRHLGRLRSDDILQHSAAGATPVRVDGEQLRFERPGETEPDLERRDPSSTDRIARALGLDASDVGLEARELGRPGRLVPALATVGVDTLVVPLGGLGSLGRASPRTDLLAALPGDGAYCFTAAGAGHIRARGFFPSVGIPEDPATGSAAASLGIYLAARVGDIDVHLDQGIEMGRPSRMTISAREGRVEVGGRCALVLTGTIDVLPPASS